MAQYIWVGAILVVALVAAAGLFGCGGGDQSSTTGNTSPSESSEAAEVGSQAEPASKEANPAPPPEPKPAVAPEPGTELAYVELPGRVNLIANDQGEGFSIVDSVTDLASEEDESTVTTYDVAGNELARIPSGSLDGECGAADVTVPGLGRVLITEQPGYTETQGIEQTEYPPVLKAWNAETGELLWPLPMREEAGEEWEEAGCVAYDGHLEGFSATFDGRWGLFGGTDSVFGGARVIDLATGQVQPGVHAEGVIGSYPIAVPADQNRGGHYEAIDPSSGQVLGSTILRADFYQQQEQLRMAARGGLKSDGGGASPTAISSDGERLIVVDEPEYGDPQAVAYSLPSFDVAWKRTPGSQVAVYGEGGGVVVESRYDQAKETTIFVGVDDATGKPRWTLPAGEICGTTESQMLLSVNGQLATIDIATGKQLSYEEGEADCPSVLPGGIGLAIEGGEFGEETGLTVLQILEP
jgi:hypothetical protein